MIIVNFVSKAAWNAIRLFVVGAFLIGFYIQVIAFNAMTLKDLEEK